MHSTSFWVNAARCARIALLLAPIAAAGPSLSERLSLEQALARSLASNKQLAAFGHRLDEQRGRLEQASLLPNPQLAVIAENVGGQGDFSGTDSAELTISLGWAIEPGLRGRRVGLAHARSERIGLDAKILRLDVAAETAQHFLSCLESQLHLRDADEAVAAADEAVVVVERRVRAGRAPNAELMRARAELATELLARDDVTHEMSVAYHRLAAQWGQTEPGFTRVDGELLELPVVPPFDQLAARIEHNPELARLASDERIAEARLGLAKARRLPTVSPTLGARRFEGSGDWAVVAGVSVPLQLFDRNQGEVLESRAAVSRLRADALAERVRVHTRLFEIYQEMQHSVHRAEVFREEVLPRLQEALAETRRGYEQGRYPYFELRALQADWLAVRRSLVEASAAAHRLVITLERLTGERLAR